MIRLKRATASLQKRIALFFLLLLIIVVSVTLVVVWQTTYNHLTTQLVSQFNTAKAVVEERIQSQVQKR
ncbi:hypothetical protein RS130_19785 [Paraglaciecola aquimarina]|uniref:Uncharacterized protein n=1 Tax=Paraglaciecola aquimarina TaxID=1235557 RepID=A0ABU3T0X0_9ALTE|nr:hypothetical protein [Paraglaciecola aquimarina]MDU0355827.1 hypothetical protein [Paraglaciecola aquimarina]